MRWKRLGLLMNLWHGDSIHGCLLCLLFAGHFYVVCMLDGEDELTLPSTGFLDWRELWGLVGLNLSNVSAMSMTASPRAKRRSDEKRSHTKKRPTNRANKAKV